MKKQEMTEEESEDFRFWKALQKFNRSENISDTRPVELFHLYQAPHKSQLSLINGFLHRLETGTLTRSDHEKIRRAYFPHERDSIFSRREILGGAMAATAGFLTIAETGRTIYNHIAASFANNPGERKARLALRDEHATNAAVGAAATAVAGAVNYLGFRERMKAVNAIIETDEFEARLKSLMQDLSPTLQAIAQHVQNDRPDRSH